MGIAASAMIGLGLVGVAAASNELAKDKNEVTHYVANGGCLEEFRAATSKCDPYEPNSAKRRVVDVEACIRATPALRECFGRNPQYFEHQYIKRLDSGLDGDEASPEQEEVGYYRWWTGMRRS